MLPDAGSTRILFPTRVAAFLDQRLCVQAQGRRLASYQLPSVGGPQSNTSSVIVDRCDVEHNTTQRWSMHPADGGNLRTARVVTVQSVDGRCLTGRPGTGGITVVSLRPMATCAPLAERAFRGRPRARQPTRTRRSSGGSAPIALEGNASDWRSVSLQRLAIPTSNSGVPVSPLHRWFNACWSARLSPASS